MEDDRQSFLRFTTWRVEGSAGYGIWRAGVYGRRVGVFTSDIYQISFVKLNRLTSQHKFVRPELAHELAQVGSQVHASCNES